MVQRALLEDIRLSDGTETTVGRQQLVNNLQLTVKKLRFSTLPFVLFISKAFTPMNNASVMFL